MICIAGKNNIAVNCLQYVLNFVDKNEICVCLTKTDDSKNGWQKSLGFYAKLYDIPVVQLEELYSIKELKLFSLEYDRIIKTDKFQSQHLYNLHFSLLPKGKGMYTAVIPILQGESKSGVTLHKIDRGIDTGNVIDQIEIDLDSDITARELYDKFLSSGFDLFKRNFNSLLTGDYAEKEQSSLHSTYFSKSFIDFKNIQLNVNTTAYQIKSQVRAFTFREYQLMSYGNHKISECRITKDRSTSKPGTIVSENEMFIKLSSIDYDVELYKDFYEDFWDYCIEGKLESVAKTFHKIPNIHTKNKDGLDAFLLAAQHQQLEMVKYLFSQGADINAVDYQNNNALMLCLDKENSPKAVELISWLVNSGLDFKKTNDLELNSEDYLLRNNIDL